MNEKYHVILIFKKEKTMKRIRIQYSIQGNGINFRIQKGDYLALKEAYPKAQPAKGLFIEYDIRSNFESYRPQLERYVCPTLLGFNDENDIKQIELIEFRKMPENIVTYTIEQNITQNEQTLQLVSG